jgi:hypothetical protein
VLQEGQLIITALPSPIRLQALEHSKFLIQACQLLKFLQLVVVAAEATTDLEEIAAGAAAPAV